MSDITTITQAARELATHIANDIANTQSRGEYIRITQFAMEADRIATQLESLSNDN
jgi:flagellin-like hook-associated protein FlgL